MLSKWCLEELKAAIANGKRIIVVRELSYTLPDVLPPEWKEVEAVLRTSPELVWLAEYNSACVKALKKFIGSPDNHWKPTLKNSENPLFQEVISKIIEKVQTTGTFDFNADIPVPESSDFFADAVLDLVLRKVPANAIKSLKVQPYKTTTSDVLKYLILQLSHLENVNIDSGQHVDNGVLKNISHRLNGLTHLRVQYASITDEAIRYLVRHNPRVTDVELVGCKAITQAGLDLAIQLPRLQRLTIIEAISQKAEPTTKLVSTDLQYLELGNVAVEDGTLELFHNLSTLKEVRLTSLKNVTSAALENFLRSLPNRKAIHLPRLSAVNSAVVRTITSQPTITHLDLSYNSNVNEEAITSILSSCHSIQELNVAGLPVNDKILKLITEGCPHLTKLNIRLSFSVTSLEPLAALKDLQELHISTSQTLDQDPFANSHKNVKVVTFTDAYDWTQSWNCFPVVVVARQDGSMLFHVYGTGEEIWIKDSEENTQKLSPFHSRTAEYGQMDALHVASGCPTCATLHSLCRQDRFYDGINMFFVNEDFGNWQHGKQLADSIVSVVKTRGEFAFCNELKQTPGLRLETVVNYVIKAVGDVKAITSIRVAELRELACIKFFPHIEGVTLTGSLLENDWTIRLCEAIPNLKALYFEGGMQKGDVSKVFEQFPSLEKIRLGSNLGDSDLENLPSLATKLYHLEIPDMTGITDATLKKIGQMTQLRVLIVSGVSAIKDETFPLLFPLQNLEHLGIARTDITAKGLAPMKDHFPKLTKLQADAKYRYDEAASKAILENHPALAGDWAFIEGADLSKIADILDTVQKWYPAAIIDENEKQIRIHYYGWNSQFDEWIDKKSHRVAPPLTHSKEYGKQGSSHYIEVCPHCPKLHGICKDLKFAGGPNIFFA